MTWLETLRSRLIDSSTRTTIGVILLALAAAIGSSLIRTGWQSPTLVFLAVLGFAAIAGPLFRVWYEKERSRGDDQPFSWTIPIAIVAALLVLTLYRSATGGTLQSTIVPILLVAAAATVVGVLIGFLFGIPRVTAKPSAAEIIDDTTAPNLQTNTNLEAISDWLTKIIVGVSLVQAGEIVDRFDTLLINLAKAGFPRPLMGGTILFFLVAGFLNGYLWTRLILTRYFSVSERALRETPEYYEGLMNAYLYQPKPQGFRKVIRLFEQIRQALWRTSAFTRLGVSGRSIRSTVRVDADRRRQAAWLS